MSNWSMSWVRDFLEVLEDFVIVVCAKIIIDKIAAK